MQTPKMRRSCTHFSWLQQFQGLLKLGIFLQTALIGRLHLNLRRQLNPVVRYKAHTFD